MKARRTLPSVVARILPVAWLSLCAAVAGPVWRQDSFAEFRQGRFGDAGANAYVSAHGRVQTINRWDFNGDGWIDILSANSHPLLEMLDLSLYFGNGHDYSIERHALIPADGPMWVAAGDLNRDGAADLVVANYSNGTWTGMDSAIYWGRPADGRVSPSAAVPDWSAGPFAGKTMLPSQAAQQVAVADLNRDGYPELIFAFSAGFWEYRGNTQPWPARIYWNRQGIFNREDFTALPVAGASAVDVADVNADGWPDIGLAHPEDDHSTVLYGSAAGFSADRALALPTRRASAVRFADTDGDRRPDVVFANEGGDESWAYVNRDGAFDSARRLRFETQFAKDVVVADFNRDGFADVFFTNHLQAPNGEERFGNRFMPSYLYWGGPDGYASTRRQTIQTIGAWGARAADLNGDGWVDLFVCNFQEHYSYEVPSFIYWNGPEGFDVTRRTPLYGHGAQGNAIADFDGDGHPDLVMTAMIGRSRGDVDPSYLYLGDAQGNYRVERRLILPGREPYEQAMADLDDDGQTEVILMNQGEVTRYENEAWIYWNRANQLDPWRMTGLPAYAGVGVEVADLDRDGYLDVVVANNKRYPAAETGASIRPGSFIYWGGPDGYVITARTALPVFLARSPSIADLNGDGHLDLVFAGEGASIYWGDGTRNYSEGRRQRIRGTLGRANHQTEVADLDRDGHLDIVFAGPKVFVYYGSADCAYDGTRKAEFPVDAKTMTIADVDRDGWLDLVCPLYKQGGRRSLESVVLLGGPNGFTADRRISLPTDGGTGSIVSDFNGDGWPDLFYFCHRKDGSPERVGAYGDHATQSRLYWGGEHGFDPENYLPIPTVGAHYDVGVDLGRIEDRGFVWDYVSVPKLAPGPHWRWLRWSATTPGRTAVRLQVRTAASESGLAAAPWCGPAGAGTWFTETNAPLDHLPQQAWIQYRIELDTVNGANSPVVQSVEIEF